MQSLSGDELWFRSLDVEDGLSQNHITAIAQDHNGFLWVGTPSGLNRFDGRHFETHRNVPENPDSLASSDVRVLHVDHSGRLWVGTTRGLDLYDACTDRFTHYPLNLGHPPHPVHRITSDRASGIWSASTWFGVSTLHRLDATTGEATRIPFEDDVGRHISLLWVDSADRLWLATSQPDVQPGQSRGEITLEAYENCSALSGGLLPAVRLRIPLPPGSGRVIAAAEDFDHRLWFGLERGGLLRHDPRSGALVALRARPGDPAALAGDCVGDLAVDANGALWVLAGPEPPGEMEQSPSLHRVDANSMSVIRTELRPAAPRWTDTACLKKLAIDQSGVLWVGSSGGGLRFLDTATQGFKLYRAGNPEGLKDGFVRAIYQGQDRSLWIGTARGLSCLRDTVDPVRSPSPAVPGLPPLPNPYVEAIFEDHAGILWIGTRGGLVRWDRTSGRADVHTHRPGDPDSPADNTIQVIHEHPAGMLWLGTAGQGLDAMDLASGHFLHFARDPTDPKGLPDNTVNALHSDRMGRLWVGTGNGLAVVTSTRGAGKGFEINYLESVQLKDVSILSIAESPMNSGVLWLGSSGAGLFRLDTSSGACVRFTTRNSGLPEDTVYGILPDRRAILWMSTNRGLAAYDPATDTFKAFGLDRGLQSMEFNARASFLAPDGEMFFGGVAGLSRFFPERVTDNRLPPKVSITSVSVIDRSGGKGAPPLRQIYRRGMPEARAVLDPSQRDLRFEFAALHFTNPGLNRCFCMLEGVDADWRQQVAAGEATYANLKPGSYTFRVKALSSHGFWSEGAASFAFVIRPPFHATGPFYAICMFALAVAVGGGHRWRVRGLRRRGRLLEAEVASRTTELQRTLGLVEEQTRQLRELDEAKSRFFANISHEFRTPLSLMIGPLEDLQDGLHGSLPVTAQTEIGLALNNARYLLELVQQLLMLAKLDAGRLKLEAKPGALDEFLRTVAAPFESRARREEIRFVIEIPAGPVRIPFDPAKLHQVVANLLSNAFDHAPSGGRVILRLVEARAASASIVVEDNGPGIRPEDLPRIFDRFYQASAVDRPKWGVGIGLSLARELVQLHGGRLDVASRHGEGATFTIHIPCESAPST